MEGRAGVGLKLSTPKAQLGLAHHEHDTSIMNLVVRSTCKVSSRSCAPHREQSEIDLLVRKKHQHIHELAAS